MYKGHIRRRVRTTPPRSKKTRACQWLEWLMRHESRRPRCKTLKDMSAEEVAALEKEYGCPVSVKVEDK